MNRSDLVSELVRIHPGYWTGLPDYSGVFLSDAGHFVSTRSGKVRILKGTRRGKYLALSVSTKGPYLHALMCETFYGPRPAGSQTRHLDGNRDNNSYDNLRWGTPAENAADKFRHGTDGSGERNTMAKLTLAEVREMRRIRSETGAPHKAIARAFGVSTMTAYRAVEGLSWK